METPAEGEASMWDNQNYYDDGTSFVTQKNHFEVMASNKARLKLELDLDFKNEMDNALMNLERNPTVKNKVWQQLIEFNQQMDIEKGQKGLLAGQLAKQRLKQKEIEDAEEHERLLDQMILDTSKTSALRAINLNQLLKKKWTEEKNSYKLLTKITTEKQNRRLAKLMREEQF